MNYNYGKHCTTVSNPVWKGVVMRRIVFSYNVVLLVVIIFSIILLTVPKHVAAGSGYLTALVLGGSILFNQTNGQIIYCKETSFSNEPPTANCYQIGTYPASELQGTFQINTNGGIVAYITNLSYGDVVLCGCGTNNTTWGCTSIR
jgi:hypothetical protein